MPIRCIFYCILPRIAHPIVSCGLNMLGLYGYYDIKKRLKSSETKANINNNCYNIFMYTDAQTTFNSALLSSLPTVIKTVGPWLLLLFILGLIISFIDSKIERKTHEDKWKTKEIVSLLRDIKNSSTKK
jgi:fucose 4-O-acetylase-like acetyltransferase